MKKPVVAVDIDDVLSANAEAFVAFSNKQWGTSLTVDDYQEHWGELWKVEMDEIIRRADAYHKSQVFEAYRYIDGSQEVLRWLKQHCTLVIVTSRRSSLDVVTRAWLEKYFAAIFDEVHFAGIYDNLSHMGVVAHTKGDIFKRVEADYVIDDQLKHCLAAAELGKNVVLFGDYSWNQAASLPSNVTRCNDWIAVKDYFHARLGQ